MLERKFAQQIASFLRNEPQKIMLVNGARQIGKSYLIRHISKGMFAHYVEINLQTDKEGNRIFADVRSPQDFYVQLGIFAGSQLGTSKDTIIFLDEIQAYPHLLTMLKFLNQEARYRYIASGSQLGIALKMTPSTPMGSIAIRQMYPLDFEEFMWAMGASKEAIAKIRINFDRQESLGESLHEYMLKMFRYYLIVGGLPEAVNQFVLDQNISKVRNIQRDIIDMYRIDASQYDQERKLHIRTIYDLIPSSLENKKKRIVYRAIENKKDKRYDNYIEEFDYLTASGVALKVSAISNPRFPLKESEQKNLLKLYLNDVGLLTLLLYDMNVNAILSDERSVNLGTVYESAVAQELHAHGFPMFYYDNKKAGEVDFIIDDYQNLSPLPIEVKSGKDYQIHSALSRLVTNSEYNIHKAIVLSNSREIKQRNGAITYMPIYYAMFLQHQSRTEDTILQIPKMPDNE